MFPSRSTQAIVLVPFGEQRRRRTNTWYACSIRAIVARNTFVLIRSRSPNCAGRWYLHAMLWTTKKIAVALQVGVVVPHRLEHLDAGQLEVLKVVRMMHHALAVGFVVANVNLDLMFQHGRLQVPRT